MINQVTIDFYERNKNLSWNMPEIPKNLLSDYEVASWIVNNDNIGWLELDIEVPVQDWIKESTIADRFYVNHRGDDHPGWNSCCLHGIDINKTGSWNLYGYEKEIDVPYHWTTLSNSTPSITNFWKNEFPVERYRRIRFMELEPGGWISPHSDMPGKIKGERLEVNVLDHGAPINIAIIHPKECFMILEGFGIVPWQPGKAIMVNIRHTHSVINFSQERRIHMIGHGWYGNKIHNFCNLIVRSYKKQYAIYRQL